VQRPQAPLLQQPGIGPPWYHGQGRQGGREGRRETGREGGRDGTEIEVTQRGRLSLDLVDLSAWEPASYVKRGQTYRH
jgi:hypothetical protein